MVRPAKKVEKDENQGRVGCDDNSNGANDTGTDDNSANKPPMS